MPTKDLDTRTGRYTVAFRLPPEAGVDEAWLAGDFNGWSTEALPMRREADGAMTALIDDLAPGTELRFRYYLGNGAWENDWAADAYVDNEFGGADSLLVLPAVESPPPGVKAPTGIEAAAGVGEAIEELAEEAEAATPRKKKAAAKKAPTKRAAAKKQA